MRFEGRLFQSMIISNHMSEPIYCLSLGIRTIPIFLCLSTNFRLQKLSILLSLLICATQVSFGDFGITLSDI